MKYFFWLLVILFLAVNTLLYFNMVNAEGGTALAYLIYFPVLWIMYFLLLFITFYLARKRMGYNKMFYRTVVFVSVAIALFFFIVLTT